MVVQKVNEKREMIVSPHFMLKLVLSVLWYTFCCKQNDYFDFTGDSTENSHDEIDDLDPSLKLDKEGKEEISHLSGN